MKNLDWENNCRGAPPGFKFSEYKLMNTNFKLTSPIALR
jgi:hypothetical protein